MKAVKVYNKIMTLDCPFCESVVKVPFDFAKENKRVFCGTCCKSFAVSIEEDDTEENI